MSRTTLLYALPAAAILLIPVLTQNPYLLHMLILVLMWVVLGQSWNLLGGYTGQVSFGHAAFFGIGAYTTGILVKLGLSPAGAWVGLLLGGLAAMVVAAVIGWICFRLRGPYFALSVLALAEVLRLVALNWNQLTNGAEGILFIPAFTSKAAYYYIVLAIAVACFLAIRSVMGSRLGYYFLAIREDQDCAESLGIGLTETFAMSPAASVSGLYFAHPEAKYFAVGKLGRDQVLDYQRRKQIDLPAVERWLVPYLNYEPGGGGKA